jgi:secondary thiamine-phosphate synthase enzyme
MTLCFNSTPTTSMNIFQQTISLPEKPRGFHLITREVVRALPEIGQISTGMCQVFIQHTSASLTINENADPTVRMDFETFFNKTVKENDPDYKHDYEGSDDMPAHLKASMLGSSVLIPIHKGHLALGTWQGIYLCEHRNRGGSRTLVITAWGL